MKPFGCIPTNASRQGRGPLPRGILFVRGEVEGSHMAGQMGARQELRGMEERRRYPRVEIAWSVAMGWGPRFKWQGTAWPSRS